MLDKALADLRRAEEAWWVSQRKGCGCTPFFDAAGCAECERTQQALCFMREKAAVAFSLMKQKKNAQAIWLVKNPHKRGGFLMVEGAGSYEFHHAVKLVTLVIREAFALSDQDVKELLAAGATYGE